MSKAKIYIILTLFLGLIIVLSFVLGTVILPFSKAFNVEEAIFSLRLSRTATAIVAGAGIGLSGLLLQTLFRNPLAGPSILGISSGATLGIALGMVLFPFLGLVSSGFGLAIMAILGAMLVVGVLLITAKYIGKSNTLLIVGLMLSYFTSAIINVITFYMDKSSLQGLVFWGLGSFSKELNPITLSVYISAILLLILGSYFLIKKLDILLLGNRYALSLGVNVKRTRFYIILIAGLLIGIVTAWCGPVAFLGVAIPHLARNFVNSSKHFHVINLTLLLGAILALSCDIISRLPGIEHTLPLNAVTSIVGAPIVVWVIFKYKLI